MINSKQFSITPINIGAMTKKNIRNTANFLFLYPSLPFFFRKRFEKDYKPNYND